MKIDLYTLGIERRGQNSDAYTDDDNDVVLRKFERISPQ